MLYSLKQIKKSASYLFNTILISCMIMHTFDNFSRVFVKGLLSIDIDTILFRDKLCLFPLGINGLTNDESITINGNFWI